MNKPAADDFDFIAQRLRELEKERNGEAPKSEEPAPQISPSEQEIYDGAGVFW